jgi:hypothetical protein
MAALKNKIIWIKKNNKLILGIPFELRPQLLFAVHGDLLNGQDGIKM